LEICFNGDASKIEGESVHEEIKVLLGKELYLKISTTNETCY